MTMTIVMIDDYGNRNDDDDVDDDDADGDDDENGSSFTYISEHGDNMMIVMKVLCKIFAIYILLLIM